ncbi:MAG: glucose-6-phosphate isomerase, partial [Negativicutes bacterium]|nr:glucose-6-phosphate isomerase [Negativicutes bacterium]
MVGEGLITTDDVAALQPRIEQAAKAIDVMRQSGYIRGHLSKDGEPERVYFSQLPYIADGNINSPAIVEKLRAFGESLRHNCDAVVSLGIGGSYLGNKVLFDVQCGEFWNAKTAEQRNGYPRLYFSGNNIDPRRTSEIIGTLLADAANREQPYRVTLICISKSGGTLDTMSNFMVIYGALSQRPDIELKVVAVTDPTEGDRETLLHRLARRHGWPMFSVPDGVGGRFSVFSEVGLITGACIGFDIEGFLAGARHMDEACMTGEVWQNPALLNAVLKYLAAEKHGRDIEVFM